MDSLIGGESPIANLTRPLQNLVKQGRVMFWRDAQQRIPAYYMNLRTPFLLESVSGHRKVKMRRKQEKEGSNRLVFEGVCLQGFVYTLSITARVVVTTQEWTWKRLRSGRSVEYTAMLNWVKKPQTPADYGVDYAMMLWR